MESELTRRRRAAGLSRPALAARVNCSVGQLVKLERGERELTWQWAVRLAAGLPGCKPVDLLPGAVVMQVTDAGQKISDSLQPDDASLIEVRPAARVAPDQNDMIPIRSGARGGDDQEMYLLDGPVGYTTRPASLTGVKEAYAVYMVGDSMQPRYRAGWLLYVNPFKPYRAGRDVVLYKVNGAVLVKEFVRANDAEIVVQALNPPTEIVIAREQVREIHLITGSEQE